jgi:hypothetical protein
MWSCGVVNYSEHSNVGVGDIYKGVEERKIDLGPELPVAWYLVRGVLLVILTLLVY